MYLTAPKPRTFEEHIREAVGNPKQLTEDLAHLVTSYLISRRMRHDRTILQADQPFSLAYENGEPSFPFLAHTTKGHAFVFVLQEGTVQQRINEFCRAMRRQLPLQRIDVVLI